MLIFLPPALTAASYLIFCGFLMAPSVCACTCHTVPASLQKQRTYSELFADNQLNNLLSPVNSRGIHII